MADTTDQRTRKREQLSTMLAVVQRAYGAPGDVLAVEEIATPAIGPEELLVRVRAVALNAGDAFALRGVPYALRLALGVPRPRHPVRGADVAGTVVAVGREVTDLNPGDEVHGDTSLITGGGLAEYVAVPRFRAVRTPQGLSAEQAAGIPMAGVTALQGLSETGRVQSGMRVLVNGASGGVGTFAVQIAVALGADVTGVCGPDHVALVRSLGAAHVVDYSAQDFTELSERFDVLLDIACNRSLRDCLRVVAPDGVLISAGNTSGRWVGALGRALHGYVLNPVVHPRVAILSASITQSRLVAVDALVAEGRVRTIVDSSFPLVEAPEAFRRLETRHAGGKIVLRV